MVQNGLYYASRNLSQLVKSVGGEWNDTKHRPIVCLLPVSENPNIFWAIPMGKANHRTQEQLDRIQGYIDLPEKDIRSCFYHIGRTSSKSIFFISDAISINEEYIEGEHVGGDGKHYIIKNKNLISELQRKLLRILSYENSKPNYFRQHITDVKQQILQDLT